MTFMRFLGCLFPGRCRAEAPEPTKQETSHTTTEPLKPGDEGATLVKKDAEAKDQQRAAQA
jgi:hypothetical protein